MQFSHTSTMKVAGFRKRNHEPHAPCSWHSRSCLVCSNKESGLLQGLVFKQQNPAKGILGQLWTRVLTGLAAFTFAFSGALSHPAGQTTGRDLMERHWEDPEKERGPESLQSHLSANTGEALRASSPICLQRRERPREPPVPSVYKDGRGSESLQSHLSANTGEAPRASSPICLQTRERPRGRLAEEPSS